MSKHPSPPASTLPHPLDGLDPSGPGHRLLQRLRPWIAPVAWLAAWSAAAALDWPFDRSTQVLAFVFALLLAAYWQPTRISVVAGTLAVLAFDQLFVAPREQIAAAPSRHALTLALMLAMIWTASLAMGHLRRLADSLRRQAQQSERLRALGESLQEVEDPRARGAHLQGALASLGGASVGLLLYAEAASEAGSREIWFGNADDEERALLRQCARQQLPMGKGTARHAGRDCWLLPIQRRQTAFGAALVQFADPALADERARGNAQDLCDRMAAALDRADTLHGAARLREAAETQALRNALTAALAREQRQSLDAIREAATALCDGAALAPEQQHRLACAIVGEADRLLCLGDAAPEAEWQTRSARPLLAA
ncbi:hypothetical protein RA210_U160010 [Rubrivivax sp. A210]|uniref:DUF4118 domain-containing protein n=1 Tax=Rubrivivax sp. A210 TaxID=2772301 RepID=UPI001917F57E|nr:DUF4118 domain-containing protein [Rubrivivax sp. A210]CAD5371597.1 hypothetical protein RA210_U160010 [Rubrivivax sp. A210]